MSSCLFCRIVEGGIPAKILYQDEQALAFEDINAQAPTHTLVIPKRHVASVQDCHEQDQPLLGHLLLICSKVARMKNLAESGYRIVTNTGADGGQTVFHLHFHVLGGRHMAWPPG
ncbi:MAG: Histidine triad nucleotide-binding protein 1 (HINT1) [Nitrospira sp.]|jgi:histidine triad (HIT) family protein|nr:MAG: Histidine triad nucleotide-binding protein 1 (HINT1) [Nitrospira sp.]